MIVAEVPLADHRGVATVGLEHFGKREFIGAREARSKARRPGISGSSGSSG
jgi:hypothetical protein